MEIDAIIDDFELLDSWDDRYRYLIELGRKLPPFPEDERTDVRKVQGCASQVWLVSRAGGEPADPKLEFIGDSDAHIVRGLIAILLAIYSGQSASAIGRIDPAAIFNRIGLKEHLTPQRSNGLRSMVERIRTEARSALAVA